MSNKRRTLKRGRIQKGGQLDVAAPKGTEISHPGTPETKLVKSHNTKLIYDVKGNNALLVKVIQVTPEAPEYKIYREIALQKRATEHPPLRKRVPRIHNVFWQKDYVYITMDRMPGNSLADEFGESSEKIAEFAGRYGMGPEDVWKQIRGIVNELRKIGILYFDITGYNFMFSKPYVSVVDFGHAEDIDLPSLNPKIKALDTFLRGSNGWITL